MKEVIAEHRLRHERSPYLLQHADNPVNWYPWGEEAFEIARKEGKPVFLSIGYSTCHWCHVMAHESFEDREVARVLNRDFISIKVDREERPDIDHIYMTVCQTMTGNGGWPLTIIMTPEGKPFFAGSYIPKTTRYGMMGLLELLPKVTELWEKHPDKVQKTAKEIVAFLNRTKGVNSGGELGEDDLERTRQQLGERFDDKYAGFGQAPKFPTPHNLIFLLRHWKRTGDRRSLEMVEQTLLAMRQGGMYDHIGYGFHRYSTDRQWLVPHFEKMLYDQALLVVAYTETFQATGKEVYRETIEEIVDYVKRVMTSPEGGFYTAEDADSEGVEGEFYLWSADEMRNALDDENNDEERTFAMGIFNAQEMGNFHDPHTPENQGKNILHTSSPINGSRPDEDETSNNRQSNKKSELDSNGDIDGDYGSGNEMARITVPENPEKALASIRGKLFRSREGRVHPHKDDKILTDWNGLMIAALAKASHILGKTEYREIAEQAVGFLMTNLRTEDGRLLHSYRNGKSGVLGNLYDYVFLEWGLIELYRSSFNPRYLEEALKLNSMVLDHFWDEEAGGFYYTPDDGEELIVRTKEYYDGALPSGNSVAVMNLLVLSRITGNAEFEKKAAEIIHSASADVRSSPMGYTNLMVGLDFATGPGFELIIVGNPQGSDTLEMLEALRKQYLPNCVVILKPTDESSPEILNNADFLTDYTMQKGQATAFVCQQYTCKQPTTDSTEMLHMLGVEFQRGKTKVSHG